MKTFNDLSLSAKMLDTLAERNFNTPTEIQVQAIPLLKQNKDLIGLSQTGTGKTFAFLIPLIEKIEPDNNNLQALILCPTRELCLQITKEAKMLAQNFKHIRVVAVYGGADINGQIFALKRKANIIVGTPGRVLDHIRRHTIKLLNINTVVLDEAGQVTEGSAMNLFLVQNGKLVTTMKTDNILVGVTRNTVIELARELGIPVKERAIDRTELYLADEVFCCGTGAQIVPVESIDHRPVGDGKIGQITKQIQTLYYDVVKGKVEKFKEWCTPVYD